MENYTQVPIRQKCLIRKASIKSLEIRRAIKMFGLPEDAMKQMLMKGMPGKADSEMYRSEVYNYLIPNIIEVISANNEAILFQLKDESSTYDQKY